MANFKGYKRSIQLGFSYDEVKDGIPRVSRQMAMLNAAFRTSSAEAKNSGKYIETLGTRYDYLSEKIKVQEQEVQEYRKKLENATNAEGNNTKAIENNTASLNIAESSLARTRAELERVNLQLSYQESTLDKNSKEWRDMEAQLILIDEEFKKNSIELNKSKDYVEKLTKEHSGLTEKISIQERQLQAYKDKLEESTTAENKNEDAIRSNKIEVAKAETALAQTKSQLETVNKSLEEQRVVLGKSTKEWEELSGKMDKMGNSLSLKLTAPLIAAGAGAFKLGADYEQALGKMEVVFEKNSIAIENWSKNALQDFGLAKSTATEMASDFGALFKGMGFSMDKTAEWSTTLTERVMDMANFYDTTVEETNRALNAIVTGQTEPLRRFGINMTQATLQEYAFANGIRKKISEMTEAEKVELRYNFVIERTNIALGTTARESDTATGQMNRLKESLKEVAEGFGTLLIPKLIPFIDLINTILGTLNGLDDGTKNFILNILMLAMVMGPVLKILGSIIDTVGKVTDSMGKISETLDMAKESSSNFSEFVVASEILGMPKMIKYALALAAAVAIIALSFDLLFRQGQGVKNMMDSISNVFGRQTDQINQAQRSINQAGRIPGYARGTNNHPGGYAIVGEEGPELLNLPNGTKVNTHEETKDILGGNDTFNINVSFDDIDEVYKLVEMFRNLKQTRRAMG